MPNRILSAIIVMIACILSKDAVAKKTSNTANTPIPLLRLMLSLDAFDTDDIAIGFLSTATTKYNYNLDAEYLPGINAAVGLSSLSSDNIPLSQNIVPLPGQSALVIRLDVEATSSGAYTLERTELDSIPAIYDIWLMDKFAKDSINLRETTNYAFNINKADSSSFGTGRFEVVIRQSPQLSLHLLNFNALREAGQAKVSWTTENEQNSTSFAVERSIDGGVAFHAIDTLTSASTGSYSYLDKTPISGSDAYRLKMTDLNGVISYSDVVTLSFNSSPTTTSNAINVYPNPSNGVINIAINTGDNSSSTDAGTLQAAAVRSYIPLNGAVAADYAIRIININGKVMRSATSSSATWQTNVSSLTPGTYVIEVVNNSNSTVVGKSTFIKL
jgi:hypothetical protein